MQAKQGAVDKLSQIELVEADLPMADVLVTLASGWLWIGGAVALALVVLGMDYVEPNARGAYSFRVLIIPGAILLWPIVLWRWWVAARGADDWQVRHHPRRGMHAWIWAVLALAIPAGLAVALLNRQEIPPAYQPVQLSGAPALPATPTLPTTGEAQ